MNRTGTCLFEMALVGFALVSAVALLSPSGVAAQAEEASQSYTVPSGGEPTTAGATGVEAGLRLGYGIPQGKPSETGRNMDEGISGQVPLWLDLGYRVIPPLFLGLYFQYGFGFVGDYVDASCDADGLDCSVNDIRFGAQVHYHVLFEGQVDPWIGAGFGYEWMTEGASASGVSMDMTAHGFEFLNLQLGLDFTPEDHFYLGPFFTLTLGQFSSVSADCSGLPDCSALENELSGDLEEKSLHEWLLFGVRGGYKP
jgi:opacity protein-like surface antigen